MTAAVDVARWDHIPVMPCEAQAWREPFRCTSATLTVCASFDEAMRRTSMHLPPTRHWVQLVVDGAGLIVFGFNAEDDTLDTLGHPLWMGCEYAYEWLEHNSRFRYEDVISWRLHAAMADEARATA